MLEPRSTYSLGHQHCAKKTKSKIRTLKVANTLALCQSKAMLPYITIEKQRCIVYTFQQRLTRLFKNRKCPEAKNSLGWCLVMILPNLSHFESLTKRCLALRNRPFRPFCDSQHQTEIFLNAQHLFLSESKWLKFGTSITE